MSKRRNAKKEKAERNKLNARKFRKPSSRYSGRGKRYYSNNSKSKTEENQSSSSDASSN
ncbi:MAG: hypothetical protein QNJ41_02995 [Xenococcaceae cyanobacterium MO_188.B32]|nr:hypothetical protein [Xenococcaceae cyanobacterium MO_188.B32]